MNWETIVIAVSASFFSALGLLLPAYWGMKKEREEQANRKTLLESEIAAAAQKAAGVMIDKLSARIDALEADLDKERGTNSSLQTELDEERKRRRDAELRIIQLEGQVERLENKVKKLEKRDTGELKDPGIQTN